MLLTAVVFGEGDESPVIKDLGENRYQIGNVQFHRQSKEITFETTLNLKEAVPLEYLLVTEKGKSHEALLSTNIRPFDLNVAFKLLGYKRTKGGLARFQATLTWKDTKGTKLSFAAHDLIVSSETSQKMRTDQWTYVGSQVSDGKFAADLMGDLISIQEDPAAIATYAGKAMLGDERWVPNSKALPEVGAKITLTLTPERLSPEKPTE